MPILASVGALVSGAYTLASNFVSLIPAPLRFILFIFLLIFSADIITGIILEDKYECNEVGNKIILQDNTLYNECFDEYYNVAEKKFNISKELNVTDNSTTWQTDLLQDVSLDEYVDNVKRRLIIFSRFVQNKSWGNFQQFMTGSGASYDVDCYIFYKCLDNTSITAFSLTSDCTYNDVPDYDDYVTVTKVNVTSTGVTVEAVNKNPFRVSCGQDLKPTLTFYGWDFLNWKLWMLLMIIGVVLGFGYKWYDRMGIKA